jgi:predicted porin
MNKKLIALAVAGAIYAPTVMAQSANPVTLYGRMWLMAESVKADGGATGAAQIANRMRISDQSSLFGIRGTEDIGGGVKACFQLETAFKLDQNDTTFAARNSGVGLQAGWGSVLMGRWDTPYKTYTGNFDPFADNTIAGYAGVMNDRGNFNVRATNVIQYWTPKIGGFEARVAWQVNEGKTAAVNPQGWSLGGQWVGGPFRVGLAYEKHEDALRGVAIAGAEEQGISIQAAWKIGGFELGGIYQQYETDAPGVTVNDQTAWSLFGTYTMGKSVFILQYTTSEDGAASTATQPKCDAFAVAWNYNVTKRTTFMMQYFQAKNDNLGTLYQVGAGGSSPNGCNFGSNALGLSAGQDPQGFAVGMRHFF